MVLFLLVFTGVLLFFSWSTAIHEENKHVYTDTSPLHGVGLFARRDLSKDTQLFQAIEHDNDQLITPLGRLINHCHTPNTYLKHEADGWFIYTSCDVSKDTELTVDYNDTPDFIRKPHPSWTC